MESWWLQSKKALVSAVFHFAHSDPLPLPLGSNMTSSLQSEFPLFPSNLEADRVIASALTYFHLSRQVGK